MMNSHSKSMRVFLTVVLAIVLLSQTALAAVTCTVNSSTKVYKTASTSATSAKVSKNAKVTLNSINDSWAYITNPNNGVNAYIPVQYLTLGGSITVYTTSSTYLYKSASTSTKLVTLDKGAKLTVTKRSGNYFYGTDAASGKKGYVKYALVSTTKPAEAAQTVELTPTSESGISCTTSSSTKIYKSASTATKLESISKNKKVLLLAMNGSWARVKDVSTSVTGYMYTKYLTLGANVPAYAASGTYLYKRASTSSKLLTLAKGAEITLTKRYNSSYFYATDKATGKKGYVKITAVTTIKPAVTQQQTSEESSEASTGDNAKITKLLQIANSYLGVPYSYSPNPPSSFDCSGFTRYCYKQIGITIPASAYTQGYASAYTKITSINSLAKGDVCCFNTNSSDSDLSDHVGIYLGNGQFIHASSAGGAVIIRSLTSGYYNRVFSWARRIIN